MNKFFIFYLFIIPFIVLGDYEEIKTPKGKKRKIKVIREYKKIRLVDIKDYIPDTVVDLKYNKRRNILRRRVYRENLCLVKKKLAKKLRWADKILRKKYKKKIKFLDCYRPWSVQKRKWRYFPNKKYVDHPYYGSKHNRGAAVDITLVTLNDKRVKMPTRYDHFSKKAWHKNKKISKERRKNRNILKKVMRKVGLTYSKTKWWHYSLKRTRRYPILDITLKDFLVAKKEAEKLKMFRNNKRKNREVSTFSFSKKDNDRDFNKEIKVEIDSKKKDIVNCFIEEFNRGIDLPHKLIISYVIRQNGKIYDVIIQHPDYKNKKDELNYCVLKVFNSIRFKRFPRSTIGQMPLEFEFD